MNLESVGLVISAYKYLFAKNTKKVFSDAHGLNFSHVNLLVHCGGRRMRTRAAWCAAWCPWCRWRRARLSCRLIPSSSWPTWTLSSTSATPSCASSSSLSTLTWSMSPFTGRLDISARFDSNNLIFRIPTLFTVWFTQMILTTYSGRINSFWTRVKGQFFNLTAEWALIKLEWYFRRTFNPLVARCFRIHRL